MFFHSISFSATSYENWFEDIGVNICVRYYKDKLTNNKYTVSVKYTSTIFGIYQLRDLIFFELAFVIQMVVSIALKTNRVLIAIKICLLLGSSESLCANLLTDKPKKRRVLCPSYIR